MKFNYKNLTTEMKENALREWELINNNDKRGVRYTQTELLSLFQVENRDNSDGMSKAVFLHNYNGEKFKYIVVKRNVGVYINRFGNQTMNEVNCWRQAQYNEELKNVLCPILLAYTTKSDKKNAISEKNVLKTIEIMQKSVVEACYPEEACASAIQLNLENGYYSPYSNADYWCEDFLNTLAENGIHDIADHPNNSGVVFDYTKGYYKPVAIDYGL